MHLVAFTAGFVELLAGHRIRWYRVVQFRDVVLLAPEQRGGHVQAFFQQAALEAQFIVTADHRFEVFAIAVAVGLRFENVGVADIDGVLRGEVVQQAGVRRPHIVVFLTAVIDRAQLQVGVVAVGGA
ncbi:hypothetical protein D3C76_820310 [compost metagenome]